MPKPRTPKASPRSAAAIREHYEIERALAARLLAAPVAGRTRTYGEVYDELFRRVPDHPQLTRKHDPGAREREIAPMAVLLDKMMPAGSVYMEIGAGDCALTRVVAARAARAVAIDVSTMVTGADTLPDNLDFIVSDGRHLDVADESVDFAFSNQLLEHLHPDDVDLHLREVRRVLRPGGRYFVITPNALTGPHDISRSFDATATGLHLKEFRNAELAAACLAAGFRRIEVLAVRGTRIVRVPLMLMRLLEGLIARLPQGLRRRFLGDHMVRNAMGIKIVAVR